MRLAVPTSWQSQLIPEITNSQVKEVYGKLSRDFVGGGRSPLTIPYISLGKARQHIKEIHKSGLEFNYLLNAACLDNREFTKSGQKRISKLLDWLLDIGVDSVTVTIPYLLQFIKRNYPEFKVYVSTIAQVSSAERARLWEDLGADRIALAHQDVNRDFKLLKAIRRNTKIRLQLIVNNGCIHNCPLYIYHPLLMSHASQSSHPLRSFFIDYCSLYCRYRQLSEPVNFIRSDWIRPEDLRYYEEIGFDEFKLVDREMPTEKIALIVKAYSERKYEGNLMDILGIFSSATDRRNFKNKPASDKVKALKYLFHPGKVDIFKLYKLKNILTKAPIYIDNRALDNFLEYFTKEDCYLKSCQECSYCKNAAERAIKITHKENHQELVQNYESILEQLISGSLFSYRK